MRHLSCLERVHGLGTGLGVGWGRKPAQVSVKGVLRAMWAHEVETRVCVCVCVRVRACVLRESERERN